MKFTKMQGIGNDYVYVNCLEETVENPREVARKVSDRHFGIGSDGLILIKPSLEADFEMDMYNSDGSHFRTSLPENRRNYTYPSQSLLPAKV